MKFYGEFRFIVNIQVRLAKKTWSGGTPELSLDLYFDLHFVFLTRRSFGTSITRFESQGVRIVVSSTHSRIFFSTEFLKWKGTCLCDCLLGICFPYVSKITSTSFVQPNFTLKSFGNFSVRFSKICFDGLSLIKYWKRQRQWTSI